MGDNSIIIGDGGMAAAAKIEDTGPDAGTPSSIDSTPEDDAGAEAPQEPAQPQKRKGGRKPIYATSEERKQRNRQAQAAFRERRTEYIKQLEATIKQNEEHLTSLQQNHRTAADECLMLRYKNSLLERILLEKGINVQAELQMKTGSPVLGPGFMQPVPAVPQQPQQPQLQRTAMQRQQARRSGSNFLPKLAPGQSNPDMTFSTTSPHAHPTPSSHASSPSQMSMQSPAVQQGGMTSPAAGGLAQPQAHQFQIFPRTAQQQQQGSNVQQRSHHRLTPSSTYSSSASGMSSGSRGMPGQGDGPSNWSQSSSAFYPSPFQKHFEQLDQEYDSPQRRPMLKEHDNESTRSAETYSSHFNQPSGQRPGQYYQQYSGMQSVHEQMPAQNQYEQQQHHSIIQPTSHPEADGHFDVDPSDPMLDADPFGLSASMHYPTNYAFEQHQGQR